MKTYRALILTVAIGQVILPGVMGKSPEPRHTFHSDRVPYCVAFSQEGKLLASGDLDGKIDLWDLGTGKVRSTLTRGVADKEAENRVPSVAVLAVAFSPDGSLLASGHDGGAVNLWDVRAGKLKAALEGHRGQILSVTFSPDGKLLAAGGGELTARVWDVATLKVSAALRGGDAFAALAFSGDGKVLASVNGSDDTVTLWDVATGKVNAEFKVKSDNAQSVAISPDGKLLAAGGGHDPVHAKDRTLVLWDIATGKERAVLKGHDRAVRFVAFSADGKCLVSADDNLTTKAWNMPDGKERATINFLPTYGLIAGAALSRDGKLLATTGLKAVYIWDVPVDK